MSGLHHLDRGYERLEHKLSLLGAHIRRINAEGVPVELTSMNPVKG
jgi:hypothetical protein